MLNPKIIGCHQSVIDFDVPSLVSKKQLVSRLKLLPDAFIVMNFYRGSMAVVFEFDSAQSLNREIELIRSLATSSSLRRWNIPFPESQIELSKTDWRILRSLQRNPRKPYASIAHDARISRRTVERRLQRMIQAKTLFAMPTLIPSSLAGTVLASLRVGYSQEDSRPLHQKISQELNDYIWHMLFMESTEPDDLTCYTLFNLALPSVAKASEILARVESEDIAKN